MRRGNAVAEHGMRAVTTTAAELREKLGWRRGNRWRCETETTAEDGDLEDSTTLRARGRGQRARRRTRSSRLAFG